MKRVMVRASRFAAVSLLALGLVSGQLGRGQTPPPDPANLRGESGQTLKRLAEAEQKLLAGAVPEAVEALQRILDEAGDDLITLDGRHYRPARQVVHRLLARLPAADLKGYQERIEAPARRLLEAARRTRDPQPLYQLLDRYFVSRPAEEGLLLLGDLLFDRGEYRAAEQAWRKLTPDAADTPHPAARTDSAAVEARLILAAVFQGQHEQARDRFATFQDRYPGATGRLAGRDGPLADTLRPFVESPPRVVLPANPGHDWQTFAGGADRSGRVGIRLPSNWSGRPWVAAIPPVPRHPDAPLAPPVRPPFGHPVIARGQVFVTDGNRVLGFDLLTGAATGSFAASRPPAFPEKAPVDPCPSLTAAGDRLYFRAGPPVIRPTTAEPGGLRGGPTAIVCLRLLEDRRLKEVWRIRPPAAPAPTVWEGAPVVAGRRLWAAYARFEGGRVVQGIACYDPADAATAPEQPAWAVDVCDSPAPAGGEGRVRHELLTLTGRYVVLCSNAGAVGAVDAVTGQRAWGFRYPRARKPDPRAVHPAPAVAVGGRLFIAPADADRVYALDADSGQLLWESGPTEGAQILGVAAGKLIVAVAGPVRGLRGLDLSTGSHRPPDGWVQHDGGGLLSYGRGLVSDDVVLWPTRSGMLFVNPRTGQPLPSLTHWPSPAVGSLAQFYGNLAYGDGVLVCVTPTQVWGYVSEARRFGQAPPPAADASGADGLGPTAAAAEAALAHGEPDTARSILTAVATDPSQPAAWRAWALARLLTLDGAGGPGEELPDAVRHTLTPALRNEWFWMAAGRPVPLAVLLESRTSRPVTAPVSPPPAALSATHPTHGNSPPGVHVLTAEARIARTLRLPGGSAPLRWLPGTATPPTRLFLATPDEVLAVPVAEDRPATRYVGRPEFTHAAEWGSGFVAAGPFAVAIYTEGPQPDWVFRVPRTEPLPAYPGELRLYAGCPPPPPALSSFVLAGPWLVARLGERHLIGLDLTGRRVAWVIGSDGRPGYRPVTYPDAPRFGPSLAVAHRMVLAQLSDGRRWWLRLDTGQPPDRPDAEHPTARVWWPSPPVEVEPNRLAVTDGPGHVRLLNLATGRVKWSWLDEREVGLSGEPAQVRAWGEAVVVAVRRNHGVELERLDRTDGRSVWPDGPAFVDADRIDLTRADADMDRLYLPAGGTVTALHWADGRESWRAALSDGGDDGCWQVWAGRHGVLAIATCARPRHRWGDLSAFVSRLGGPTVSPARLPLRLLGLYDAWADRFVPVLLLDRTTGRRLGEWQVPAIGSAVTAYVGERGAVVATSDRVVWIH